MSYDTSITVFSPTGNLHQVDYAAEAVRQGGCAVAVAGRDCIVFAVEHHATPKLQDNQSSQKVFLLDKHIVATFSGLQADARILVNRTRAECQSYRLRYEDPASVRYIARHLAIMQQRYTQRGGVRPFGVATLLGGFSPAGVPELFLATPQGSYIKWHACAIGRRASIVEEYLLEHYPHPGDAGGDDDPASQYLVEAPDRETTLRLAIVGLLQVVDMHTNPISVVVHQAAAGPVRLPDQLVDQLVRAVDAEA